VPSRRTVSGACAVSRKKLDATQPRLDVGSTAVYVLAAGREGLADRRSSASSGVLLDRVPESAHRMSREWMDRLASEIEAFDEREHDPRGADVPDRATDQERVVRSDRRRQVDDAGARVLVLLVNVPLNGRFVAVRVRIDRLDLERVAAERVATSCRLCGRFSGANRDSMP
jgi:hypothetical protein